MAISKSFHGSRSLVSIYNPMTSQTIKVGWFDSININLSYDVAPVSVLGRFTPVELVTTGVEPVTFSMSGFKILDHDWWIDAGFTNIKDLLLQDELTVTVTDRLTGRSLAIITGVKPTAATLAIPARQLASVSGTYTGLLYSSETTTNAESASAATLP